MRPISFRAVAICIFCGSLLVAANAQSLPDSTALSGPATMINSPEFDRMIQTGTSIPDTPELLAIENQSARTAYSQNVAIVESYLRANPKLTDLAALARMRPNRNDPNVKLNANGTYAVTFVNSIGQTQTVQNFGPETKMAQLAASIQTASDPAAQLRNYTALYNQLPASFINGVAPTQGVTITRPIPPSQLQGASLATIQNALDSVVSQWPAILQMIPLNPNTISTVACELETGADTALTEIYYGDETPVAPSASSPPACSTPWSLGILANFTFANKGAISCVKNQGYRGTCGVFAATSAVEELIAINTGIHVNLSEQDFWEKLTLQYTSPPQIYSDGYDAGNALSQALVNNYQFAYENQWNYNPSWSHPTNCNSGQACYAHTCTNYPYPSLFEPACSNSSPQAVKNCTSPHSCVFTPAVLSGHSPYSIGPGKWLGAGPSSLQSMATSSASVVGSVINIWNPSGLAWAPDCSGCPPIYGQGPHPNLSVDYMILALAFNNTVILGFEETNAFGNYDYVPYDPPPEGKWQNCLSSLVLQQLGGGAVPDICTDNGGHNIHVVGFITNDQLSAKLGSSVPPGSGGGYFILKNSWGPCAGDVGYFYMPVDYVKARAQAIYVVSYGR